MSAADEHPRTGNMLPGPIPALIVGCIALAVCALYGLVHPESFFQTYLIAFVFWVGVSLGSLAIVEIGRLTGGAWAVTIGPFLAPAARTIPVLAVLFLPVLFGVTRLYPWAMPNELAHDSELRVQTEYYLNVPAFVVRAVIYFLIWLGSVSLVLGWRRGELLRPQTEQQRRRVVLFSAIGLMLFGLTTSFSGIDWAMSLEAKWYSSIYGAIVGTGQLLGAFAFGVLVVAWCWRDVRPNEMERSVLRDLGNLLMAFTMVWMYMAFSQFLLVWSGNLREEIPWYLRRGEGVWPGMAAFIAFFQFAVPFSLLLSQTIKESPRKLFGVALLAFAMRFFDIFWLVAPSFPDNPDLFWLQPLAYLGIGGIWVSAFLWLAPTTLPAVAPASPAGGELAHD